MFKHRQGIDVIENFDCMNQVKNIEVMQYILKIHFYIHLCATLNKTFAAEYMYNGVLPRTP